MPFLRAFIHMLCWQLMDVQASLIDVDLPAEEGTKNRGRSKGACCPMPAGQASAKVQSWC